MPLVLVLQFLSFHPFPVKRCKLLFTITSFFNSIKYFTVNLQFFLPGELMFLNEATFLDNLKTRYYKDKIYVSDFSHFNQEEHLKTIQLNIFLITDICCKYSYRRQSISWNQRPLFADDNKTIQWKITGRAATSCICNR